MASNSPRLEPARAARTASWSFSGAGETAGELSHGHDLHAIGTAPRSSDTDHVPGQFGVDDDGAARDHVSEPCSTPIVRSSSTGAFVFPSAIGPTWDPV
jgi:hypothetical protein